MAPPFGVDETVRIPGGSLPQAVGWVFKQAFAENRSVTVTILPLPADGSGGGDSTYKPNSMASFSSWGPTMDGRIKPDITAPGDMVRSARSSMGSVPTCATTVMSGTSMATPLTAGAAALVRQYYTDGFYPTGRKVPGNAFEPTGALVKATLLNGAASMSGFSGDGYPLDPSPSMSQGFGRVDLINSVHIDGHNTLALVSVDGPPLKTQHGRRYCLKATPGGAAADLKVTLVW
eukprot:jgi/Mesen1/226/ME1141325C07687